MVNKVLKELDDMGLGWVSDVVRKEVAEQAAQLGEVFTKVIRQLELLSE